MPLSEYEQRVLEQMERQLTSDDPRLATTMTSRGHHGARRYVVAVAVFVGGLLLLVAGAAQSQWWLGVLGFVLMFGSVVLALYHTPGKKAEQPGGTPTATDGGKPTGSQRRTGGLMSRLEERWDKRREQGRG